MDFEKKKTVRKRYENASLVGLRLVLPPLEVENLCLGFQLIGFDVFRAALSQRFRRHFR